MRKYILAVIVTLLLLVAGGRIPTKAEGPQEVQPYEFANIPVISFDHHVRVYKVVHEGCEIFISVTTGVRDDHTSMATGRGCK